MSRYQSLVYSREELQTYFEISKTKMKQQYYLHDIEAQAVYQFVFFNWNPFQSALVLGKKSSYNKVITQSLSS